jgi:hypothetical protein
LLIFNLVRPPQVAGTAWQRPPGYIYGASGA